MKVCMSMCPFSLCSLPKEGYRIHFGQVPPQGQEALEMGYQCLHRPNSALKGGAVAEWSKGLQL